MSKYVNDFKVLAARHSSTVFLKLFTTHAVGSSISGKSASCMLDCVDSRSSQIKGKSKFNFKLKVKVMPGVRADLELSKNSMVSSYLSGRTIFNMPRAWTPGLATNE